MLADLRISLYELFANLVPGVVILAASAVLFWAAFFPRTALELALLVAAPWYVSLLIAYLAGLAAQVIAGALERRLSPWPGTNVAAADTSLELTAVVTKSREMLSAAMGLDLSKADLDWIYRLCDEALIQVGQSPDRESYRYREGLFRGLSVAFLFLTVAFVVRAVIPGAAVQVEGIAQQVPCSMLLTLAAIAIAASIGSLSRFQITRQARFTRTVAGFVVHHTVVKSPNHHDSS